MSNLEWYSAKTVCKHQRLSTRPPAVVFEERVVLLLAENFDDAIAKGEAEAREYCSSYEGATYTGFIAVYCLAEPAVGHGTEVYSLMRESELIDSEYLDHFYDDGNECTQITE